MKTGSKQKKLANSDFDVKKVLSFPGESIEKAPTLHSRIGILFEDSKGGIWMVAHESGVYRFDGTRFRAFAETRLDLKKVRAMHESKEGSIWFALDGAVLTYDENGFKQVLPDGKSKLIQKSLADKNHNSNQSWEKDLDYFWFSSFNKNGVYRFDGERLTHFSLPVPPDYPDFGADGHHPQHGYDTYAVYGIYKSKDNKLWLGTAGAGLFCYDGKSVKHINKNERKGVIRAMYQDHQQRLWFGNNPDGILQYQGDSLRNFSKEEKLDKLGLHGALAMVEDSEDHLWIGTYDNGLWKIDLSNAKQERSSLAPKQQAWLKYSAKDGLGSNYISALLYDSKGRLWVGTGNGRIFLFNGNDFKNIPN